MRLGNEADYLTTTRILTFPLSVETMQIIYRSTGRFGLVTCALISFVALTWGMWLFTVVTPAFYWFGVPAIFIIFYTACHCAFTVLVTQDYTVRSMK